MNVLKPFLTDDRDVQRRALIQCEAEFSSLTHEYARTRTLMGPLDAIASGLRDRVRGRADTAAIAALEQECSESNKRPFFVASVGYPELWPEHRALFFNEISDGPGWQNVLAFTRFTATPQQVLFYDKSGLIAVLVPCERMAAQEPDLSRT
jgi:hypothetical protein